ncbi:MAG: hypothetical protein HC888_11995 [Candidatus Competibacteraceae bacterium]|nr:hypothetical protein [Candidatus Competibacteraceae bacterium]
MIDLLFKHMMHPEHGTGIAQFAFDWTPLRAIIFKNVWGSDRDVDEQEGRPLNNTSFGHNVEFGWLLLHSVNILALDLAEYKPRIEKLMAHCVAYGIDWQRGGVYCEGPHAARRASATRILAASRNDDRHARRLQALWRPALPRRL